MDWAARGERIGTRLRGLHRRYGGCRVGKFRLSFRAQAHIQEPVIDHQNTKQITSEKELDAALKRAAARLTVIHFYTPWYPPCFKMAAFIARLSAKYQNVQ